MRIAADARSVFQDRSVRGIGKSLIGLYRGLATVRPDWQFDLYFQDSNGLPNPLADCPNIQPRRIQGRGDRFKAWLHFWLPFTAWRSGANLIHCHGNTAPHYPWKPLVTTIHDLTMLAYPTADPNLPKWIKNVTRAAHTSCRILTPSHAARQDIATRLVVPPEKIDVVWWGPTGDIQRTTDPQRLKEVRGKYGLSGEYLIHFGMALPRKNTPRVLEAWCQLPPALRATAKLLVVGVEEQAIAPFQSQVDAAGAGGSCLITRYIPEADLSPLLSDAAGVVYVPLAEGFGVPILDAFACETPVLAGNRTSLPEVAGDAAVLVDPERVPEIAQGMSRLLTEASLRDSLRVAGRERLALFNWNQAAEQVARIFEQVARR